MNHYDFLVIGGGIAGASLAYRLAGEASVLIAEREEFPAYHTTGRSAAFYVKSYGHELMRPLTVASYDFLNAPPADFSGQALLKERGSLWLGKRESEIEIRRAWERLRGLAPSTRLLGSDELASLAPMMRPQWRHIGIYEPDTRDIDVNALHAGFLRGARRLGADIRTAAEVLKLKRKGGVWHVETTAGSFGAGTIVNAAGAWADEIADRAGARTIGLIPKRRTVIIFPPPPDQKIEDWPLILDINETFYFKPESGRILASPSDAAPTPPCDVQPEEEDIARAAARIEEATFLNVERIERKWAGLRTFTPDEYPAVGNDPDIDGFFWLAGQGGAGIQTAPALSDYAAALLLGRPFPDYLKEAGIKSVDYAVSRLLSP